MTRFYVRLAILLLPLFTLLAILMSALGSTQPPHPALRGFVEGCEGVPQPCWYGARPGITTVSEFGTLLRTHQVRENNPGTFCNISQRTYQQNAIARIDLLLCKPLALAELLNLLDISPMLVQVCGTRHLFDTGTLQWSTHSFNAYTEVDMLTLHPAETDIERGWHGFAPRWFYAQLYPSVSNCGIG